MIYNIHKKNNENKDKNNHWSIIENNFDRFTNNVYNIYFNNNDELSYDIRNNIINNHNNNSEKSSNKVSFEENNKIKSLQYYLEHRAKSIINYSLGKSHKENNGIIVNVFSTDKSKKNIFSTSTNRNTINNNIEPFFNFKSNFLIFHKFRNLFFEKNEIWLCPIETTQNYFYEKISIELNKSKNFTFSSNEYLFCKNFVNSVKENIKIKNILSNNFPFDHVCKIEGLNINCLFNNTVYFYELDEKLRKIYLEKFNVLLDENNIEKDSMYFSKMGIYINEIKIICQINKNKDLIDLYFNASKNFNESSCINFINYFNEKVFKSLIIENNMKKKISINKTLNKENNNNKKNIISDQIVKINEFCVNKFYFEIIYKNNNNNNNNNNEIESENEEKEIENKKNENKFLSFILNIENIKYNENDSKENQKNNKKITKAKFLIDNFILNLTVPKNFKNEKDFYDSENRIQINDLNKILEIFNKMKNNKLYKKESIILKFKNFSMKLLGKTTVNISINNFFKFGFLHNNKFENILSFIPFGISKEDDKQIKKYNINNIKIDKNFKKSFEIIFSEILNKNIDYEIFKFYDSSPFSSFSKMIYIIQSTFEYKLFYQCNIHFNVLLINFPNRIYHYIYYLKNWMRIYSHMLNKVHPDFKQLALSNKNIKTKINNIINQKKDDDNNNNYYEFNKNNINNILVDFDVPIKGAEGLIATVNLPIIFFNLSQDNKEFSNFIFYKNEINLKKNDNNEIILNVNINDFNWRVLDCNCKNLIIKNKNLIEDNDNNHIIQIEIIIDDSNSIKNKKKIFNNKIKHQTKITFSNCKIVSLFKYINEVTLFLDINEFCLNENPLKSNIFNLLYKEKQKTEDFYFELNNLNIIIPENSKSSNYLSVFLKKANVTINKLIDELKLINIPNNKIVYVIDKKSLYGLQSEFITIENCPFEIEEEQKKLFKEKNSLFLFNESIVDINDMQIISKIDKFEKNFGIIGKSIFNISNLKSMDVVTRLYEYYFKQNKQKNIKMKTGMNVNLYDINANITMSDIEVINHFVDSNIDEKSPIFSEEEAIFNNIDLDIKFNQNSEINLDMFKMFNEFFKESNKLEKINEKLPGYDNEITYDSEFSIEEEEEQINN